jgi:hypothetical protein
MNKSPEQFELNEKTQLYLPAGVDASRPWTSSISHQEILGQREVIGVDGHGSIRNESSSIDISLDDEKLDNSINNMLDPKNIIDLKEKLENKASRLADESTFSFDKRLDKDGELTKGKKDLRSSLKASLIDEYTQLGADKESPREIPETVMSDISRMLDMSFDELESRIVEDDKPEQMDQLQTMDPNEGLSQNPDWTTLKPEINTRVRNQADFDIASNLMGEAIFNGDSEQFEKAYKFLQNEVIADRLITGEKHEKFEDEMSRLREKLESNKVANRPDSSVQLPPPPASINNDGSVASGSSNNRPIPVPIFIKTNDDEPVAVILPDSPSPTEPGVEINNKRRNKIIKALVGAAAVASVFGIGAWLAERNNDTASEVLQPEPTEVTETSSPETTVATDETSPETTEADVQAEEIAALEQSIKDRTVQVSDTTSDKGDTPWDKATELYGDQASIRLIQAAEAVAADGIEVSWSADPYTSKTAQLTINGSNDPSIIWQFLSTRLAKQDVSNYLANVEAAESALPATE